MGVFPELQHQSKAHYIYNSPSKAADNALDPSLAINNVFLLCGVFLHSEFFPCPWLHSLILYYPVVQMLLLWTSSLKPSFCPFSVFQAVGAPYVPVSMDELLHPLGLCDLATVGKCPETAPAHPFIFQHNLKILCIRMFFLSEQYSALSALTLDGVKDALNSFRDFLMHYCSLK